MITTAEKARDYITRFSLEDKLALPGMEKSATQVESVALNGSEVKRYVNEFWTSRQRQANSLQEISYRACFKPQLPRFFLHLFTMEGDTVYDPFSGRGTTAVEAAMEGRYVISNDVNPISGILTQPRFFPPTLREVEQRLAEIAVDYSAEADLDLSMFYHRDTEAELVSLRNYLRERREREEEDHVDSWIRMVATNRLTGHSPGFFSVYTLPPNQAVSRERQIEINKKRGQSPPYRNTKKLIARKTKSLLRDVGQDTRARLARMGQRSQFCQRDARNTGNITANSVKLTVTSPPFLDVVQYSKDNWLRCWFNNLDEQEVEKKVTTCQSVKKWCEVMGAVFEELFRITQANGWVAFEVGEVKKGRLNLDEYVAQLGMEAGFSCAGILVNKQSFTKTSNIWGVKNNSRGTNTNRVVLFCKQGPDS